MLKPTCRKISGILGVNTSDVIDDPRRGAKVNDSRRGERDPGTSDTSPAEEITNDNVSNDAQKHSYVIKKEGRQTDVTKNRKDESEDISTNNDDMNNDIRTPADETAKGEKHTNEPINQYDMSDDNIMISNPQIGREI